MLTTASPFRLARAVARYAAIAEHCGEASGRERGILQGLLIGRNTGVADFHDGILQRGFAKVYRP
jgi:hypothetical protein